MVGKYATWRLAVALAILGGVRTAAAAVSDLYIQTGTDPTWQQLLDSNAIPIGTTSYAGVVGSTINVNNTLVEVGPNRANPIISNLRLHTLGNPSVTRGSFSKWSRWYQEDGNTQVFRLFKDEVNVQNTRPNAARSESFNPDIDWAAGDGWYQWQGTYTMIKPIGACIFQAKNSDNDWSVQINMGSNGNVTLNRRTGTDETLASNMVGVPFHITVYDNGTDYMVYMNDVYRGYGSWSRPTGVSEFRWGMYVGDSKPGADAMLFVTGAKITANVVVPPRLSTSLAAPPARVIKGATVSGTLSVWNSIPVTSSTGAARLDYSYSSSGLFGSSGTGSDMALGTSSTHRIALNTGTVGLITGTVAVAATTPLTATPTASQTASTSVIDSAIGSFAAASTLTTLDIDFGTLTQGPGSASRGFSIFNRAGSLGTAWTAKLDLDSIAASVPGAFSTTLASFSNLASGSSRAYSLAMQTTTTGSFSGTYSLNTSDEDLPGATTHGLSLRVRGHVVSPANVVLNVASGTQTQGSLGYVGITGTSTVTATGSGTIVLDQSNSHTGGTVVANGQLLVRNPLALGGGTLQVLPGATVRLDAGGATVALASLDLAATGTLDLQTGAVVLTDGALFDSDEIIGLIARNLGNSSSSGPGIISSSIQPGSLREIGYLAQPDGSLLVGYAASGDTNLDSTIDILDAANFLAGSKFDAGVTSVWSEGDFTYDGVVDILDAAELVATGLFDNGVYNAPAPLAAAVPEPGAIGIAGIVAGLAGWWPRTAGRLSRRRSGRHRIAV